MSEFREIVWSADGVTLCGYLRHTGNARNLVLIPGSGTHHSIWEPVLAESGIEANVLLAELPGFGRSHPAMPEGSIETFTALTLQLIGAAGFDRFVIGGHSIGGMMAIEMLDHAPQRLDGVIACEGWTHASVAQKAFAGRKNETLTPEQMAARSHYAALAREDWSDDDFKRYARIWQRWENGRRLLDHATVPILELWGDRGILPRPSRDALMIPARESIVLEWIPNGGHSFLVQDPHRVGAVMARFLAQFVGLKRQDGPDACSAQASKEMAEAIQATGKRA